jgi:iron complex transport system substrate-binding protein
MKNKKDSKLLRLLLALTLLLCLTACKGKSGTTNEGQQTPNATDNSAAATNAATDTAGEQTEAPAAETAVQPETSKYSVDYTDAFSIEYIDESKDIKLVTDAEGNKFLLVPKAVVVPTNLPSGCEDATVVRTPISNVVYASTTQVFMLRPFGDLWDSVRGVSSLAGTWGSEFPEIEAGLADGSIFCTSTTGGMEGFDYEAIADADPDMVFLYTGDYGQTDLLNKCKELGITCAVDNEYLEESYLGRLEWIKFIAAFYNRDEDAANYFDSQLALDENMKQTVSGVEAKTKVAWASVYSGTVYVPGNESYVAKQIEAAGGDYIFKDIDGTGSATLTLEEFYDKLAEADVLIYSSTTTYCSGLSAILENMPLASDTKVFTNDNVWLFNSNYYLGTDESVTQTTDIAAILNPDLYKDYTIKYFVKAQ